MKLLIALLGFVAGMASCQAATYSCSSGINCGNDVECLSTCSNIVVMGTVSQVISPNGTVLGPGSTYSASVVVQCSFKGGVSLAGQVLTISGFSNPPATPTNSCNGSISADGKQYLFFIYISSLSTSTVKTYAISTVCYGGIPVTADSIQHVSNVIGASVGTSGALFGSASCTLPAPQAPPPPPPTVSGGSGGSFIAGSDAVSPRLGKFAVAVAGMGSLVALLAAN
ncbi:uncharacterized protein BJ171DRAFT_475837 [Polychytrium aggregatum]|uniref:uncharacterized protein n=1 Tax=Polychytrium aggregatum TaxID=110093 RepID=UPI0022FDFF84|nr:uncharacterized protein BJ171DRAFT_475837 [Polychytrium aggregatum]KAI9203487.1 hypothetical protein BJ171DRAFT_475837 [Polychytrium aggregatum]